MLKLGIPTWPFSASSAVSKQLSLLLIAVTTLVLSPFALAAPPQINAIPDQTISLGQTVSVTPSISGQGNGAVNWSIAYGPDAVEIEQGTGKLSWAVPGNMPSESFYIGVRASNADGADIEYFIVHAGVSEVVNIGPSHDIKNFADAFRQYQAPGNQFLRPGITYVVEEGVYSDNNFEMGLLNSGVLQSPFAGNSRAYTTVMAESPGKVELREGAGVSMRGDFGEVSYIAIKGFFFNGTNLVVTGVQCRDNPSCTPHHIKFVANGVYRANNRGIGASFMRDLLLENNYVFGGGRAKVSLFHVERAVVRRNVVRFDWVAPEDSGPQNTFSFYTSVDVAAQNNIAVDSDSRSFWPPAEDAGAYGCPVTEGPSRVEFHRNIQLNSEKNWGNMDNQNSDLCVADLNNNVSWDASPVAGHVVARGAVDINHMTVGDIEMEYNNTFLIDGFPNNTRGMRNSIIHNTNASDIFRNFKVGATDSVLGQTYPRTGVSHVNISGTDARLNEQSTSESILNRATITRLNPIHSASNPDGSLKYIVRPEPRSNLSDLASDGAGLGATVMTMRGASGTLWGESGFREETNKQAWPVPMQEIMHERMRAMRHTGPFYTGPFDNRRQVGTATLSGNRGFATAGKDLTHYIWGYLGNAVPPMNVTAQSDGQNTIVRWDPPAPGYEGSITGYRVYDYNSNSGTMSNPRNVGGNRTSLTVNGSNGNTSYVVTAIHNSRGEGGYSYPSNGSFAPVQSSPQPQTPVEDEVAEEETAEAEEEVAEEVTEAVAQEVPVQVVEPAEELLLEEELVEETAEEEQAPSGLLAPVLRILGVMNTSSQ